MLPCCSLRETFIRIFDMRLMATVTKKLFFAYKLLLHYSFINVKTFVPNLFFRGDLFTKRAAYLLSFMLPNLVTSLNVRVCQQSLLLVFFSRGQKTLTCQI